MPNHCTNLLSCKSGKTIGSVIKPYLTHDGKKIDFNKIIPMPEGILKTIDHSTIEEITKERTEEERESRKMALKVLHEVNMEKYGYKDWYDWSIGKWDTKWNAYSCYTLEDDFNEVEDMTDIGFQTAWSPPINVIRELAKLTGETFRMSYYDEGWDFAGEYIVSPDGEDDNCYEDMDDIPEGSELYEECDLAYFYDLRDNEEED